MQGVAETGAACLRLVGMRGDTRRSVMLLACRNQRLRSDAKRSMPTGALSARYIQFRVTCTP